MCNKTDNSQEQTDETVKYFGFLLYLLAWYASTRKKKKKKALLVYDYNNDCVTNTQ